MKNIVVTLILVGLTLTIDLQAQTVGEPAPDFEASLVSGDTFRLSDHQGKVIVLFTFGNTCPSCLAVGNDIENELHQAFRDDPNFVIVGLDTWNTSSSVSSVTGFKNSTGITFPLAIKAASVAASFQTTYDRLLVIDDKGLLVHKGILVARNDLKNTVSVVQTSLENIVVDPCLDVEIMIKEVVTNPSCYGHTDGAISVEVTGPHPDFEYSWSEGSSSNGIMDLEEGTYSLMVTDSAGCTAAEQYVLQDPDSVGIGEIMGDVEVTAMQEYTYSVSDAGDHEIVWTVEGGAIVNGQGTNTIGVTWGDGGTGVLTAMVITEDGCMSPETSFTTSISNSITSAQEHAINELNFFPNPVKDLLTIQSDQEVMVSVFDINGQLQLSTTEKQVDLSGLTSGIYTISIQTENEVQNKILVKE